MLAEEDSTVLEFQQQTSCVRRLSRSNCTNKKPTTVSSSPQRTISNPASCMAANLQPHQTLLVLSHKGGDDERNANENSEN